MRTSDDQKQMNKLMAGGGQQGNVTGGQSGIPGILGLLQQQSNPQIMTNKYNPLGPGSNAGDFINFARNRPDLQPAPGVGVQTPTPIGQNPMSEIMGQLQKLLMEGPGGGSFQPQSMPIFDPNRYKDQAQNAVNSQFNPILDQIRAQQQQTQSRAGTNKQAVAGLYQGAVNDINVGAAATQKQYDQTQQQSQQLYTDERNRIAAGYAADANAQRQEAKRLGTEALGVNEAIAAQNSDKQFADQMGSQQMQSSQQALGMQEQGAADYDKAIAQATRGEGINAQQDIMRQLEDYMSSSNSDIASTQSQAAGATNDLMYKLAQAAYDRDAQNAQFQYQQQRDFVGDQNNLYDQQKEMLMQQLEMAQAGQQQDPSKLNPWQSVATFADQLQPGQGSDIIGAIQGAMSNRPEIYARSKEDPVPMNPALFAKLIAEDPNNAGMDRNTLMQVSQELYRLLYGT